jgi:beta-lactamase class A
MNQKRAGWLKPSGYYSYNSGITRRKLRNRIAILAVPVLSFALVTAGPTFKQGNLAMQQAAVASAQTLETLTPLPAAKPVPTNNSQSLQLLLSSWNSAHPEHKWSVVVTGLGSDERQASINGDISFTSASIYKLLLMYRLFSLYNVDSMANVRVNVEGRGSSDLKTCVELMIKVSDNSCGIAVGNLLGWTRATSDLHKLGLSNTNLSGRSGPTTTASDTAQFLAKIQAGELFSDSDRQYLMDLMQLQTLRSGIPAGCSGCIVADKTGDLSFVRHDAGIINYPGGSYVLSIFTDGAAYSQIAELTSQIQAVMLTH